MLIKLAGRALALTTALGTTAAIAAGGSPTPTPIALTLAQYVQTFDSLSNTAGSTSNVLPDGWQIYETGTATAADGYYAVGTGSGTTGGVYSFGSAGSTDRALGSIGSGTASPLYYGAFFTNSTGVAITTLTIAYSGEEWRRGGTSLDYLAFDYSTNTSAAAGINDTSATWNSVGALFYSPLDLGGATALDGNANSTDLLYTITGLNIAAGSTFAIRWTDIDSSGNDDGLAIDNVKVTANATTAVPEIGTWAMMTVGFGALGAALRRRRKPAFA